MNNTAICKQGEDNYVINLQKGEKISLTKENSKLTKLLIGLGWDTNGYSGGFAFDLDASAFLLDQNGKASGIEDFSIETAIVVCEIYRHNDEWKFGAVGSGFSGGLQDLCANYGLQAG